MGSFGLLFSEFEKFLRRSNLKLVSKVEIYSSTVLNVENALIIADMQKFNRMQTRPNANTSEREILNLISGLEMGSFGFIFPSLKYFGWDKKMR